MGNPPRLSIPPPAPRPCSLGLHTPGGHVHHLDVGVPQAPVEAQALAGVGGEVGGGHRGPCKEVEHGPGVGGWQARPHGPVEAGPGVDGPAQGRGVVAGVSCGAQDKV